ncbi:hypothetical protein ACFOPO_16470 [Lysobacter sp. GCM10012299]
MQVGLIVGALIVLVLGWSLITGHFWEWRADVWKGRAQGATQTAHQAKANADSANAGAANATQTRQQLDAAVDKTRAETKRSAERIKPAYTPAKAGPVPLDVLRELKAGDRAYRAAVMRLQAQGRRHP